MFVCVLPAWHSPLKTLSGVHSNILWNMLSMGPIRREQVNIVSMKELW